MTTYTYTDPYGYSLQIRPSGVAKGDVKIEADVAVDVPVTDLPMIVAKMYEAAGRKPPVAHEHVDDEDVGLSIVSSEYRPDTAFIESHSGAYVTPADLPSVVRKLYEAAGQEPPIILSRRSPEMSWVADGGYVRTLLTPGDLMTPLDIRDLCSWYASAADLVEAETERQLAEVERELVADLATVIYESGVIADSISAAGDGEKLARAILAAGYTRSES